MITNDTFAYNIYHIPKWYGYIF